MVDNSTLLRPLLTTTEGQGHLVQLIKRKKDGNDETRKQQLVSWEIYKPKMDDEYAEWVARIKKECDFHKVRAYINPNAIDLKRAMLLCAARFLEDYQNNNYNARASTLSVYGLMKGVDKQRWIVDVDNPDSDIAHIVDKIKTLQATDPRSDGGDLCMIVPTPNGFHIITHPFRVDVLNSMLVNISLHKNNPTILYAPET